MNRIGGLCGLIDLTFTAGAVNPSPCYLWHKVLTSPRGHSGSRPTWTLALQGKGEGTSHSPLWIVHGAWRKQTPSWLFTSHIYKNNNHSGFNIVYKQKTRGEIDLLFNKKLFKLKKNKNHKLHKKGKHLFPPADTYRGSKPEKKFHPQQNVAVHKFIAH